MNFDGRGQKITITITITTIRVPPARGGRKRSNPATTTTHSGMGVKETHNTKVLWEQPWSRSFVDKPVNGPLGLCTNMNVNLGTRQLSARNLHARALSA